MSTQSNLFDEKDAQLQQQAILEIEIFRLAYKEHVAGSSRPNRLERLTDQRLADILRHAVEEVPVYVRMRSLESEGGSPWSLLGQFPFLTKLDLAEDLSNHCSDSIDPSRCSLLETTGSTGVPLRVIRDIDSMALEAAAAMARFDSLLPSLHRKVLRPCFAGYSRWIEYSSMASGFTWNVLFGLDRLSAQAQSRMLEHAIHFAPHILFGFPSNLLAFSEALRRHDMSFPRPVMLFTCGELLTSGAREALEEDFQAPLRDIYAMKEVGNIAVQCPQGSYHVEAERIVVEIIGPETNAPVPDRQPGEIVVTDLGNRAMPLIRYRTGDFGYLTNDGCSCGSPAPCLNLTEGRRMAAIRLSDGAARSAFLVARILRLLPIQRFQIVQQPDLRLSIRLTPRPALTRAHLDGLAEEIRQTLGDDLPIEIDMRAVDEYETYGQQKASEFISRLP